MGEKGEVGEGRHGGLEDKRPSWRNQSNKACLGPKVALHPIINPNYSLILKIISAPPRKFLEFRYGVHCASLHAELQIQCGCRSVGNAITDCSMMIHPGRSTGTSPAISDTHGRLYHPQLPPRQDKAQCFVALKLERPSVPTKCFEWPSLDGG